MTMLQYLKPNLARYATTGLRLDLTLHQGSNFGAIRHVVRDRQTKLLKDLTGYTAAGAVKRDYSDVSPLLSFSVNFPTDRTEGWYEFWLTAGQVQTLTAGITPDLPESIYVWDFSVTSPEGYVRNTFFGQILVQHKVG